MRTALSSRRIAVIVTDTLMVSGAFLLAFLLRFDLYLDPANRDIIIHSVPYAVLVYLVTAHAFSLYKGIYHFSSFADLVNITKSVGVAGTVTAVLILFVRQGQFPRSVLILHPLLSYLGVCGVRFGIRIWKNWAKSRRFYVGDSRRVLIVGAGDLGESLLRQMLKTSDPSYEVIGFIDDDPSKWGMRIHGHNVLGGRTRLAEILKGSEVDEVAIAIASRRGEMVRSVMDVLCRLERKVELKIVPSLDEMMRAPGKDFDIRDVKPADLLNREVVRLDEARIARVFEGQTVLVTGGGGTIGGELCNQVLRYGPAKIIVLDNHATSLFYKDAELREKNRGSAIVSVLGDIRDQGVVDRVFKTHRPQVVLHAAAHKHVHQLEFNVQEGIGNNILGTYCVASAADRYGAGKFLLISSDKAVRPSSVMGATKRVAEIVLRSLSARSKTCFCAVRFGNVLGSSASVLPIFQEQIARGGPVTVTDPKVTRYFMTVEEAVGLILQAISMSKGGEVFILKMGTPMRILDMAKNLILLSGLEPGKDIDIRITGLRQGEKMDEELAEDPAGLRDSDHPDVMVLGSENDALEDLPARILEMEILSRGSDAAAAFKKLQETVPSFRPTAARTADISVLESLD